MPPASIVVRLSKFLALPAAAGMLIPTALLQLHFLHESFRIWFARGENYKKTTLNSLGIQDVQVIASEWPCSEYKITSHTRIGQLTLPKPQAHPHCSHTIAVKIAAIFFL